MQDKDSYREGCYYVADEYAYLYFAERLVGNGRALVRSSRLYPTREEAPDDIYKILNKEIDDYAPERG